MYEKVERCWRTISAVRHAGASNDNRIIMYGLRGNKEPPAQVLYVDKKGQTLVWQTLVCQVEIISWSCREIISWSCCIESAATIRISPWSSPSLPPSCCSLLNTCTQLAWVLSYHVTHFKYSGVIVRLQLQDMPCLCVPGRSHGQPWGRHGYDEINDPRTVCQVWLLSLRMTSEASLTSYIINIAFCTYFSQAQWVLDHGEGAQTSNYSIDAADILGDIFTSCAHRIYSWPIINCYTVEYKLSPRRRVPPILPF